ncbi:hypothetical protein [Bradyrhizobium elkanii]|uniref:hypothetical protein n=1 Tax=Bradyrhizobium elkanii TaxID=29448 RepID=UPI003BAB6EC5
MALDQLEERHDGEGSVADLVGQRRQGQVDPLGVKAYALAIERDMHADLSNRIIASNCEPIKPRGVAWKLAAGSPSRNRGRRTFPAPSRSA